MEALFTTLGNANDTLLDVGARQDAGFRVQGSGFRVWGAGFRVWGAEFRVWGAGFRGWDVPLLLFAEFAEEANPRLVSTA